MPQAPAPVRCRTIQAGDLDRVTDLLARGFPMRPRAYWTRGLARQRELASDPGGPTPGYVLDAGGRLVGVLLLIFAPAPPDAPRRCCLSSWFVEPAFRGHASLLVFAALRRKDVTYVNVSAAPHTWPTIEAQGFRRYAAGTFVALPALAPDDGAVRIMAFRPQATGPCMLPPDERELLSTHAAFGCLSVVATSAEGATPFVFSPLRIRGGRVPLPGVQLVYCRSVADLVCRAGPLGRFLLRRGAPFVAIDSDGLIPDLPGWYGRDRRPKFFKGPVAPRLGDLAYSELAVFGP